LIGLEREWRQKASGLRTHALVGAEDQLWYSTELERFFSARPAGPLVEDLRRVVVELAQLISADPDEA
jgi:uncharacterized membrane protein YhiD involved in acid resistance